MVNRYDEQLFLGYIEGDLAPPEKVRFEKMMAEDKQLSSLVAQMIDDRRRLRRIPRDNPPADLIDQVTSRLERNMLLDAPPPELNPVTQRRGFRNSRVLAYAALAAMVLVSTAVVMHTLTDEKLYDQLAVTGGDDQALAKKDSKAEQVETLSTPRPATGLRTESLALRDDAGEIDSIEGRPQPLQRPVTELQPPQLALGKSKASRERSLEESVAQLKVSRVPAITLSENAQSVEIPSPESSQIKQNRASDPIESNDKIETFALLTPPQAPAVPLSKPQQAPGDLAQKIMKHMALLEAKSPAADTALEKTTLLAEEKEATLLSITPHRDDHTQTGTFRTSLKNTAKLPPQPMQINAWASDIAITQQTLLEWVVTQQIQIIQLAQSNTDQSQGQNANNWDVNRPTPRPSRSNQIVLTMPASDIPQLLEHLNEKPNQSAQLVAQPQFWNQVKRQIPSAQLANTSPRPTPLATTDDPKGTAFDRRSQRRIIESDDETNYPQLPVIAELDWGQLLLPRLPFRPVVPVYAPDTPIHVTVNLYEQSEPTVD